MDKAHLAIAIARGRVDKLDAERHAVRQDRVIEDRVCKISSSSMNFATSPS